MKKQFGWQVFNSRCVVLFVCLTFAPAMAYYQPETGRFLQRDPLGVNPAGGSQNSFSITKQYFDGLNLYEYVKDDPIDYRDPLGTIIIPPSVLFEIECCACLAYSEAGRSDQNCLPVVIAIMKNRQNSGWADFKGEDSFCSQAAIPARFEGGVGSERYGSCMGCMRDPCCKRNSSEKGQMKKAISLCINSLGGGGLDPTGGAQFWFTKGKSPQWMKRQERIGNCSKVTVPGCDKLDIWKCEKRPVAQ